MKRIINILREQLDFSIEEAKGAILAAVVIIFSIIIYYSFSLFTLNQHSEIIIRENAHTEIPEYKSQEYEYQSRKYDFKNFDKNNSYSKGEKFSFDPNTASEVDFKKMGFPMYVANTIIKYRSKGGKFRYKEDLKKIYILKPEVYEEFQPYILLPEKNSLTQKDAEENLTIKINTEEETRK